MTNLEHLKKFDRYKLTVEFFSELYPSVDIETLIDWLNKERQLPILTDELRDYIKHARAIGFHWVAQDGYSDKIFLYTDRPEKNEASNIWDGKCSHFRYDGTLFDALFEKYPGRGFALEDILTGVVR